MIISFPGQGIWSYMNDASWVPIHSSSATHIAAGNLNGNASKDLVIDFGAGGLWIYRDASVFRAAAPVRRAEQVVIGDFDGDGLDDIAHRLRAELWSLAADEQRMDTATLAEPSGHDIHRSVNWMTTEGEPPARPHSAGRGMRACGGGVFRRLACQ